MSLTPEQKADLINEFTKFLDDPTCEASIEVGTHGTPNYSSGYMEFAPTKGRTITGNWAFRKPNPASKTGGI